jgi:site-specific DNA recombinase
MEKPHKPSRVIGYVRVSTEKQDLSHEAQTAKLEAYAKGVDLTLVDVLQDKLTAKNTDRPGLQRALAMLHAGEAEGLLILKLDRLTRSVVDLGNLLPLFTDKFELLSIGDSIDTRSAGGRLVLNVLTSVSQWEREAISERTKFALKYLKSTGVRLGAPPLEGAAVDRMYALRLDGCTLQEIADTLTAEGFKTKRNKAKWSAETVRKVLARGRP